VRGKGFGELAFQGDNDDGALTRQKIIIGDRLMKAEIKKVCLFCKYFVWRQASPDWSEVTPGSDLELYCERHYWQVDPYEDTRETYRKKILTAESCDCYQLDPELLEDGEEAN
jgi:hypothetical protein